MYSADRKWLNRLCTVSFMVTQFRVEMRTEVEKTNLMWSGGCKHIYTHVDVTTGKVLDERQQLGSGVCVVEYVYSGANKYINVYCHPSDVQEFNIPLFDGDLTTDERTVLGVTKNYTSKYRREHANLPAEKYDEVVLSLVQKGLLSKNKGLTVLGRNSM